MTKLVAALGVLVLLAGCAGDREFKTWSPFSPPQKYACDSGNSENKAFLCYIAVDVNANPPVPNTVVLYHRHITVAWVLPEGYEFDDKGVELKDPNHPQRGELTLPCAGPDEDETKCPHTPGRYFHLHAANSTSKAEFAYTLRYYKVGSSTPVVIDPTLVNQ